MTDKTDDFVAYLGRLQDAGDDAERDRITEDYKGSCLRTAGRPAH